MLHITRLSTWIEHGQYAIGECLYEISNKQVLKSLPKKESLNLYDYNYSTTRSLKHNEKFLYIVKYLHMDIHAKN